MERAGKGGDESLPPSPSACLDSAEVLGKDVSLFSGSAHASGWERGLFLLGGQRNPPPTSLPLSAKTRAAFPVQTLSPGDLNTKHFKRTWNHHSKQQTLCLRKGSWAPSSSQSPLLALCAWRLCLEGTQTWSRAFRLIPSRPVLCAPHLQDLPAQSSLEMQETQVQSLSQEDPLQESMATHSSIFAWRIPGTEEPCGLQSMGSQRVRHD